MLLDDDAGHRRAGRGRARRAAGRGRRRPRGRRPRRDARRVGRDRRDAQGVPLPAAADRRDRPDQHRPPEPAAGRRRGAGRPRRGRARGVARDRARRPRRPRARASASRVIGMGKCGGRELNYVSDVDVIYVAEPVDGVDEAEALAVGARLAAGLARACSTPSVEPALWPVDAALRPEGKNGPLVRTIASHKAYYERWAKTWEFQALLKARPLAGDRALGQEYVEMTQPFVWGAVTREHFVEDSQAMRRRVESHVPAAEADRQIKLGVGGLRDVEFTVQLLQLVHGRADESIRSPSTLTALAALAAGGYVGRSHAAQLAVCYRLHARARAPHPAAPPAPHAPHAHRGAGPAPARPVGRDARRGRRRAGRALEGRQARRPRPARGAVLPPAPAGDRAAVDGGGEPVARRGARPARGDRLPRPGRRHAAHRGAHRGAVPSRGDPAPAAARHARLVRGRRRPRRRAAGVPSALRRARHHALVPQAAPRLRHRRRDGWPGCSRPAATSPTRSPGRPSR